MFAIKCGEKFLNTKFFLDAGRVFDVVVSDTAKTFKTRAEADRVLGLVQTYLKDGIEHAEKVIEATTAARARHRKDVIKYQAKIDELVELPYKEVHKRIRDYERKMVNAQTNATSSVTSGYSQDLARLRRLSGHNPVL